MAAHLKGLEVTYTPVHRDDTLTVSATGMVPALIHNGASVSESMAIMEYMEEVFPAPGHTPLLPADPVEAALTRSLAEVINSSTQPMQNMGAVRRAVMELASRNVNDDLRQSVGEAAWKKWGNTFINRGFGMFEKILAERSGDGDFAVGGSPTVADVFLLPQAYNAATRYDVDLSPYPLILRSCRAMAALEAVRASSPFLLPDAPPEAQAEGADGCFEFLTA